ncbi:restriction endonuclease [Bacillus tropicus]|uniref:restriction endonuclease n=1 Tax=Bacillus cereus group TaxID=86661 RepID=UPI001CFF51CC|nr:MULTISPECIES: restriction endonuclease [Bacillus cereus group]MCB4844112.1 restriction endonuclease [Bacillus tropicus]MDA1858967.1 restriction endonuclease [Bacillus cereus group sp. BY122LC]
MSNLFIWILLNFLLSPIVLIPTLLIIFLLVFYYKKQLKIHKNQIEAQRIYMEELRQSSIHEIDQMNGRQFEEYLSSLYQSFGYHTEVTKGSGDFGADLILKNNNDTIIVQAKRYSNKVSLQAVQEIVAAKGYYNANHAWVVTNNYFTEPARKLANANDVLLIDRNLLIKLSAQVNRQNEQQRTNLEQSSY